MEYTLVEPDVKYKEGFDIFINNYSNSGEKLVPFVLKLKKNNFTDYVSLLKGYSRGIGITGKFVPHSTFWLIDKKNSILGVVNIRHSLTDSLKLSGGHIGYGVAPMFRRKGYATIMLKLALEKAGSLGVKNALITCDKSNIASAKTILNNKGILDSEEMYDGKIIQRYLIAIDR